MASAGVYTVTLAAHIHNSCVIESLIDIFICAERHKTRNRRYPLFHFYLACRTSRLHKLSRSLELCSGHVPSTLTHTPVLWITLLEPHVQQKGQVPRGASFIAPRIWEVGGHTFLAFLHHPVNKHQLQMHTSASEKFRDERGGEGALSSSLN